MKNVISCIIKWKKWCEPTEFRLSREKLSDKVYDAQNINSSVDLFYGIGINDGF